MQFSEFFSNFHHQIAVCFDETVKKVWLNFGSFQGQQLIWTIKVLSFIQTRLNKFIEI